MNFKLVRRKNPMVKRDRLVMYDGELMRIANTSGDGLKLRKQILCHANDEHLTIIADKNYLKAVEMIESAVESVISNWEDTWDDIEDEKLDYAIICKHMRQFTKSLKYKVRQLDHN